MKAVISRTSSVSGMTTPAILSAAVVDTCNSWIQRLIGLCAPSFGVATTVVPPQSRFGLVPRLRLRAGPWCDHGLLSFVIVTATIGDVDTADMEPTYLLAATRRGDWVAGRPPADGGRRTDLDTGTPRYSIPPY